MISIFSILLYDLCSNVIVSLFDLLNDSNIWFLKLRNDFRILLLDLFDDFIILLLNLNNRFIFLFLVLFNFLAIYLKTCDIERWTQNYVLFDLITWFITGYWIWFVANDWSSFLCLKNSHLHLENHRLYLFSFNLFLWLHHLYRVTYDILIFLILNTSLIHLQIWLDSKGFIWTRLFPLLLSILNFLSA